MKRSSVIQMLLMVVVTVASLGAVLATNTEPVLGLDLQGGI